MKQLLAGAAFTAALMALCAPAQAATPDSRPFAMFGSGGSAVDGFYALRGGRPLWLASGPDSPAAQELIELLRRAPVEGMASGPSIAGEAQALMAQAAAGNQSALMQADQLLSTGWVEYVQLLRRQPEGMTYAEQWIAPRAQSPSEILSLAAAAPSLAEHVKSVSSVNPFYSALRIVAYSEAQSSTSMPDPRLFASLDRARAFPSKGRYIVVDAASARLLMVEDGHVADSMKVIVGKRTSQTPMVASVIHYATLNPYWNVPPDLVRSIIAANVVSQGTGYLKAHNYEVLSDFSDNPQVLAPKDVDWKAVASGRSTVRVRQLPGPANSMGHIKFGFANSSGVYLHDTPKKELFAGGDRDLSNGCVRLEDADRLGRWLLGRDPTTDSAAPEQQVLLPKPVPVYVTYLTAHVDDGQLTLVNDIYGRDQQPGATLMSLR